MKYKKSLIFIILMIFLFGIASVCASDANQTVTASDNTNQELDLSGVDSSASINKDDLVKISSDDSLNLNDNDEKVGESRNSTAIVASDLTTNYNKADLLTVTLTDNQNNPIKGAHLSVTVENTKVYVTNAKGQINIPTSSLDAKTYDVNINFGGDEKYAPSAASVKIIVNKINSSINCNESIVLDYGTFASFSTNVIGATGITAKIGDKDVEVKGMVITTPELDAGDYDLKVTTIPEENYNSVTKIVKIKVNKVEASLSVSDTTMKYGGSSTVQVNTNGAATVVAKINGKGVTVKDGEITLSDLDVGKYTLTVTAIGDDNHITVTEEATVTVIKVDSDIGIKDLTLDYGSPTDYTVTTVGATKFTAEIDGKSVEVSGNIIKIPKLDVGSHTLTVKTVPDANHNSVTKTSTLTVKKAAYQIKIYDVTLGYGSKYNLTVTNDQSAKITAKIDGKDIEVSGNTVIIPKLDVGNHKLTVSSIGDENHDGVTKTATITVNKAKTLIKTSNINATVGINTNLIARLGSTELASEGVMTFYVGETKIGHANVIDGIALLVYNPSKAGNYNISVVYEGTSKYQSSNSTFELAVSEKSNSTEIKSHKVIAARTSNGDVNVEIELPSDTAGTVTLTVNDVDYTARVVNGISKITLTDLEDGIYSYTIVYSGDADHIPFSDVGRFNVTDTNPGKNESTSSKTKINFPSLDGLSSGSSVKINLPKDATGSMTLTLDGNSYKFPVENGAVTISMPKLASGVHLYTITYSGDSKYLSFTRTGTITPAIEASNVKVVYSDGSYYTIKVNGTNGKSANNAAVKISGKISKSLTTKNGIAKFKITQAPGTYKITITSLGKSVTKTITVKHLLTLKSVTVKKSAKKLTLQATLAKLNEKYLKNKKITFKFNGKTYTAKTDKKGVAKVTIKSSVLKKLKVGKKITYQATYSKDTVKKSVKVKK